MKTFEEIEQLAEQKYKYSGDVYMAELVQTKRVHFTKGYTQCQEDVKSLLLEIKDNWKGDKLLGGTYEKICNSLNKQN